MTILKPRIFIGSSSEAKTIAAKVQKELSSIADCKVWHTTFEFGNAAYEDLLNNLSLYDYGIFIATKDDVTRSRHKQTDSPRDNVVFEFGLYAGRLGRRRALYMAEQGVKILSDLGGITLPFFPPLKKKSSTGKLVPNTVAQNKGIRECCEKIVQHITKQERTTDFGFFPSTALAYGYYTNFIEKSVKHLMHTKVLTLGSECKGRKDCIKNMVSPPPPPITSFKTMDFRILIPSDLRSDMYDKVHKARADGNWEIIKIDSGTYRPFDFSIHYDKSKRGKLHLYDIPLTLNALNEAIQNQIGKTGIGRKEEEELLEQRELRVFQKVLDYLIDSNSITRGLVKTEIVKI